MVHLSDVISVLIGLVAAGVGLWLLKADPLNLYKDEHESSKA